ncbi:hypothetical protein JWG45_02325 [Leptospira sp. 201903070]|uniref:Lipoprotein n=1 Tax=Leptospira ainlahdjerensis TaxID=2810033 RepID=A0ABS2U758_9LEPT|nr:hypothetical protein [Leptospira ainlahdjerensis]MBM9575979.1 hypothetical protein [Leptospira ainlahdjerensis]
MLYFDKKFRFLISFILFCGLVSCVEKKTFIRLERPSEEKGRLYVIRPMNTALAMWSYDFHLEKFKGHFKNNLERETITFFELENGHFFTDELEEGFYRLSLPSKPGVEKIFKMDPGKRNFFRFLIFNEKKISIPDFFIQEISEAEALSDLLENDHLYETNPK